MREEQDTRAMALELQRRGLDREQARRSDFVLTAAKMTAIGLLCARHGCGEGRMFRALRFSRDLAAEFDGLVARIERAPATIGYVHSGLPF